MPEKKLSDPTTTLPLITAQLLIALPKVAMSANVFVYGTLTFPEVLQSLVNRVPRSAPATIKGFHRYGIRGQVFPGTIPSAPNSQVSGLVLFELTEAELHVFDEFEGQEYYKQRVQPVLEDGSTVEADVYLWQDRLRPMLVGDWSPEEFQQQHLASYTQMCARFAEELQQG